MENQDIRNMTADTIGKDLLGALLAELRLLPKPWEQLAQAKQDDVIDRLRKRVETNVKMPLQRQAGLVGPELFRAKQMLEKLGKALGIDCPADAQPDNEKSECALVVFLAGS